MGDDDGVPVPGGTAGHELLAGVGRRGLSGRHQDVGQRIGLEELGAELFEHVVGDHEGRFGDQTEALHLHARHDHGGGLAGADGVAEQHGRLLHRAPGGVELVGVGYEGGGEAGEGLVAAVPGGEDDGVEQFVVAGGQSARRALVVLPDPGGEAVREGLLLLSGQQGRLGVEDPAAVAVGVVDHGRGLIERLGEQAAPHRVRSVPQVDVMTRLCFCQVGTAMVQVAMTSTCSVATWVAPRVSRTKADTSLASIQVAPGRASISSGNEIVGQDRRGGRTTLGAKRRIVGEPAASASRAFRVRCPRDSGPPEPAPPLTGSSKTKVPRRPRASAVSISSKAATRSSVTVPLFVETDGDGLLGAVGLSAHLAGADHPFGKDRGFGRRLGDSGSKSSRASREGKSGSVRNPPSLGLRRPMIASPGVGICSSGLDRWLNRLIGP